ncbi:MAG: hypothetical protein WBZ11_08040 [Candidatus Sulfotelmatobacter sp.]|jgi:hypothetical protein
MGRRLYRAKRTGWIAGAVVLATARALSAQSCAMCYQSAAASGGRGKLALQHGILILALPAIAIFGTILSLLYIRDDANEDLAHKRKSRGNISRDESWELPEVSG